jgi:hypothetical protein
MVKGLAECFLRTGIGGWLFHPGFPIAAQIPYERTVALVIGTLRSWLKAGRWILVSG